MDGIVALYVIGVAVMAVAAVLMRLDWHHTHPLGPEDDWPRKNRTFARRIVGSLIWPVMIPMVLGKGIKWLAINATRQVD